MASAKTIRVSWLFISFFTCIFFSVSISGCCEKTSQSPRVTNNIHILLDSINDALHHRERHKNALKVLREANAADVLEATLNYYGNKMTQQVVFLAVADDQLQIPGVTVDLETRIFAERRFVEIPGCGDDESFISKRIRKEWYSAVNAFAVAYNSKLEQTINH